MIEYALHSSMSQGPFDSILGSILQRLRAAAVAAYVTGVADKEWLLADYACADDGVGRAVQRVQPHQELASLLSGARTAINSHSVPYRLFFAQKDGRSGRPYACAWAPVRWEGELAGGLAVASSSERGFGTHQLNILNTMADELARRLRIHQLITSYRKWGDRDARNQLVQMHLGLIDRLCNRFAGSSEPIEDLRQVGAIALLTAIDRYRPDQGCDFAAFVSPCITGELLNYFRDHHSPLKLPRSLQRLKVEIDRRTEALVLELGRFPTVDEVTNSLEATQRSVHQALQLNFGRYPLSLDAELNSEAEVRLLDLLAEEDPTLESASQRISLAEAVAKLDQSGKTIIRKKFYEDRTQAEIGEHLGVSQMHVSRLQKKAIARLKEILTDDREPVQVT